MSSNISESINSSLTELYKSLVNSFSKDSFSVLDNITFIDSDIIDNKYFESFLDSQSQGIIMIANSLLLAILIYYIITYFFSRFSGNSVENPFQFLIKLVICSICVNYSYFICEQIIDIFDTISSVLQQFSFSILSLSNISFESVYSEVYSHSLVDLSLFTFDGVIQLFISFGFFNLLLTYSYRYIVIKLLILLSPFFILTASLNSTSWLFKMWIKNFLAMLSIQIVVFVVLVIIYTLKSSFSNDTIKILYIGSLYTLMKTSSLVKDFSSGFTSDLSTGFSSVKNTFL